MRVFYEPIYKANVALEIGKPSNPRHQNSCETLEKKVKNGVLVCYKITVENKKDFYGLQHECIHLVKNIFTDRGIRFDETNDEAIAYYFEYWFKKLWRAMNQ